ncbi:hypothetical protein [Metallibacterium scheffleri]|uniref:hypothetical protein n=1 Tax=Metallibacterium scheffleri TaxID=993689 RepID=UPI0009BF88F8|nr:hypothetical protein [Metallibacterium scheffleri]
MQYDDQGLRGGISSGSACTAAEPDRALLTSGEREKPCRRACPHNESSAYCQAHWPFSILHCSRLLEDRPFTVQELRKLFAPYRETRVPLIVWRFPNDEELRERRHWVPTLHEKDTSSLVRRGDIWGFIAAVWVARMCEAQGELDYHFTACMDVYRAAPAALKESWLAPHVDQLFKLLETVRYREISTFIMFDVDLDIIKRQASDPNHEPIREYRPRDPLTHRFVEIEDPVLPAHWIPGTVWRDQQRRREQRRATLKKSHRPSPPTT